MEKFSQRMTAIKDVRDGKAREDSQRRLNNNDVVIKHGQGHLVDSEGL